VRIGSAWPAGLIALRSRLITITDKGLAVFREVKAVLDPTRGMLLEGFTDDELGAAERLLDRFFAAIGEG
jgi:DNA-binding MarR family transcriptional regulator